MLHDNPDDDQTINKSNKMTKEITVFISRERERGVVRKLLECSHAYFLNLSRLQSACRVVTHSVQVCFTHLYDVCYTSQFKSL